MILPLTVLGIGVALFLVYQGLRAIYQLGFRDGFARGEIAGSRRSVEANPSLRRRHPNVRLHPDEAAALATMKECHAPRMRRRRDVRVAPELLDTGKVVALRRRQQLTPNQPPTVPQEDP